MYDYRTLHVNSEIEKNNIIRKNEDNIEEKPITKPVKLEVIKYKLDDFGEIKTITLRDETGKIATFNGDIVAEKYYQGLIKFTNLKVKRGQLDGLAISKANKTANKKVSQNDLESLNKKLERLETSLKNLEQMSNISKDRINKVKDDIIRTRREIQQIKGNDLSDINIYTTINNKIGLARQRKTKDYSTGTYQSCRKF